MFQINQDSSFNSLSYNDIVQKITTPSVINICSYDETQQKLNNDNIKLLTESLSQLLIRLFPYATFYLQLNDQGKIRAIIITFPEKTDKIKLVFTPNIICPCCKVSLGLSVDLRLIKEKNIINQTETCNSIQQTINKLYDIINLFIY